MAFSGISNKLDPENKGKKQKIILAGAGLLVLAGAAAVYFNFFQSPAATEEISSLIEQNLSGGVSEISIDKIIEEIDFDAGFLESSRFQALKVFKDWPLKIEQKGRSNPFSY